MSKGNVAIIFFQFTPLKEMINEVRFLLSGDKSMSFAEVKSADELLQMIEQNENSIIFSCLEGKDDLTNFIGVLKHSKKHIKSKRIRFAAFNLTEDNSPNDILKKLGCKDVFEKKDATARKIKFKVSLWKKMLKAPLLDMQEEKAESQEEKSKTQNIVQSRDEVQKSAPSPVGKLRFIEALSTDDDFWCLKKDQDAYVDKNGWWHVRLRGPSPTHAYWELDRESGVAGEPPIWKMVVETLAPYEFKKRAGNWRYQGDRPYYSQKEKKWFFTGELLRLYVIDETNKEHQRLYSENENLFVAKNSASQVMFEKIFNSTLPKSGSIPGGDLVYKQGQAATPTKRDKKKSKTAPKKTSSNSLNKRQISVLDPVSIADEVIDEITQDASIHAVLFFSDKQTSSELVFTCEFDDLFDGEVTLLVRRSDKFPSSKVRVLIQINVGKKQEKISFYGQIEEREKYDETRDLLIIYSDHIDERLLDDFAQMTQQRQGHIQKFLKLNRD